MPKVTKKRYDLYACLPFVELRVPQGIAMGPVTFWPANQAPQFIDKEMVPTLAEYLESVTSLKAWSDSLCKAPHDMIDTVRLSSASLTCVSIDPQIPMEARNNLLLDAIYLLFFCGAFSSLYAVAKAPCFDVFTKIIPASPEFLQDRNNWRKVHILEAQRECPVTLEHFDKEMCTGLGHALACAYCTETCKSSTETYRVQSLIRAIRYFVDRFFERFENLLGNGLVLSNLLYEAEDIVFLATSYEALFDLVEEHPNIDLKHKLRPILGLRYSSPVELLWQWVDGFFHLKEQIIHGRGSANEAFHGNPNFEISYFYLGMKLFVYGVYWRLHTYELIDSKNKESTEHPIRFPWVQPEELLTFFWPEETLIHRMSKVIGELARNWNHPELRQDLTLLGQIFMHTAKRYNPEAETQTSVKWKPTPNRRLREPAHQILEILESTDRPLQSLLPADFVSTLRARID